MKTLSELKIRLAKPGDKVEVAKIFREGLKRKGWLLRLILFLVVGLIIKYYMAI